MATDFYHFAQVDGPDYAPGGPLLFAFHGTGGNEAQFLDIATQLVPEARVIAPRGDVSEGGALRFFKRAAEGVYDMADLSQRTDAMAAFIKAHIDAAKPSAVFGLGYSNGANIMASVADKAPGLFTHAVMMHPLVTWDMGDAQDLKALNVLITAGGRDPICPPDRTGRLAEMLEARGATVKSWWHTGGHEITREEMAATAAWLAEQRVSSLGSVAAAG